MIGSDNEKFGDRFEVSQDEEDAKGDVPDALEFIGDNAASLKASPEELLDAQLDEQVNKVLRILSKVVYTEVLSDFFMQEQLG